jgi:6,7-dimethyl-8-ribityllumazine synthase
MALDAAATPYDGVVALGCVIQGETYHFEIVSNESARALMDLAIGRQIPLGNGIITVDTQAQAIARASADDRNKGAAAARAALAMVTLKRSLGKQ